MSGVQELANAIIAALTPPEGVDTADADRRVAVRAIQVRGALQALVDADEALVESLIPHVAALIRPVEEPGDRTASEGRTLPTYREAS